jgi:acyl carrier protein
MTILEKVIATLAKQLEIEPAEIDAGTDIVSDLGADSLDLVELIMELEKTYNIVITGDETGNVTSVGDIAAFIERKLNA